MVINVYEQYFAAEGVFGGVGRTAALVMLVSDSEAGNISYKVAVTFFPHSDEEDFAVSYDAYFEKEIYNAPGRRSKKREATLLERLREEIDSLVAAEAIPASDGTPVCIYWDRPLREARMS